MSKGKVVVQSTSGTAEDVRALEELANRLGFEFELTLTEGAISAPSASEKCFVSRSSRMGTRQALRLIRQGYKLLSWEVSFSYVRIRVTGRDILVGYKRNISLRAGTIDIDEFVKRLYWSRWPATGSIASFLDGESHHENSWLRRVDEVEGMRMLGWDGTCPETKVA